MTNIAIEHGPFLVSFPIKNDDFPISLPEGSWIWITGYHTWLVVWNMNFIFPSSWDDDPI